MIKKFKDIIQFLFLQVNRKYTVSLDEANKEISKPLSTVYLTHIEGSFTSFANPARESLLRVQ